MDTEEDEQLFTNYTHKDAFLGLLSKLLEADSSDDAAEDKLVAQLGAIVSSNVLVEDLGDDQNAYEHLDIYLPAPPLLDPHLHLILPPLIATVRTLLVQALAAEPAPSTLPAPVSSLDTAYPVEPEPSKNTKRLARLGRLIWWVLKARGWKACLSFFPPSLPSLPLLLSLFHPVPLPKILPATSWELRYILLVWLSLVSMIPFGLESAGGEGTIAKLDKVGTRAVWEGRGKEGEGGAVLLGRLFARTDCSGLLPAFLSRSTTLLSSDPSAPSTSSRQTNPYLKASILTTLSHFVPSSPSSSQLALVRDWLATTLPSTSPDGSGLIRKLRIKLLGRCALAGVPAKKRTGPKATGRGRLLGADDATAEAIDTRDDEEEMDVPEEVEDAVEDLMNGLEDKDTIVRWSSAKYVSRLSSLLPLSFADQIAEAVIALYARDAILVDEGGQGADYDLSAVKESTWHGASLAVAEMARRGVLSTERLEQLVPWLLKAMTFDPRTSSHSTGTSVRDASCYVLWSLARAFSKADMGPYALALSRQAVALAVADREVSIRRAGSAAFQENVGRMGLFPHGIDVLVKTDFYSVSVRRSAFLVAAPHVAQHEVYRSFLLEHFGRTTLRHWDKEMRQLGAAALRALVEIDFDSLGPQMVDQLIDSIKTMDSTWTHGILLALGQLAQSYAELPTPSSNDQRHKIFSALLVVRPTAFRSFSADQQLAAACQLISSAVTPESLASPDLDKLWRDLAELCLKSRNEEVHDGVASVWGAVSRLINVEEDVTSLLLQLKTFNTVLQQTIARIVGTIEYGRTPGADLVVKRLLDMVEPGSKDFILDVETRRNSFEAICNILSRPSVRSDPSIEPPLLFRTFAALFRGLDDYTSDQRGDVGSWIRVACLRGATSLVVSILDEAAPEKWLNVVTYHGVVGKVLKLGTERIDGVRKVAGECLKALVEKRREGVWVVPGMEKMRELFVEPDAVRWNEAASVFPRVVPLVSERVFRRFILEGLTLSIGSRSEGTTRTAAKAFLAYLATLPPSSLSPSEPSLLSVSRALVEIATVNVALNRVFIPVLDTLVLLFEDGDLARLSESASGKAAVRAIFSASCRDLDRIRNLQRVTSSLKILTGMVSIPACAADAVKNLPALLGHRFPTVRSATAEQLYLVLQTVDLPGSDEIEDLLLSTSWSSDGIEDAAKTVLDLLHASVSSA